MNVGARLLRFEMGSSRARNIKRTVQMNINHGAPFVGTHVVEEAVTQNASVVDHGVDPPKGIERLFNHAMRRCPVGHAVAIGACLATGRPNLVHHGLSPRAILAFARHAGTQIIDQHSGALGCQGQRELPANAATGPGDQHDLVLQKSFFH